jgi:glycerol-3-phosphate dehydrogenase
MLSPSQGIHFVLPREFLPGDTAIMIPKTDDGRVLFAVPWHGRVVVGTTDTPVESSSLEPRALPEEIDFIFTQITRYLTRDPGPADVLSVFAGLRPLIKAEAGSTAALSRDHHIGISDSGLITIAGGKWTTYRKMAEDVIDHAEMIGALDQCLCNTQTLAIHGSEPTTVDTSHLRSYGSDAASIRVLIEGDATLGERLHPALEFVKAEVIWHCRHEMARTVEDVLSRRTRALLLDARVSIEAAPVVAELMANELGKGADWAAQQVRDYRTLAAGYLLPD